MAEIDIVTVRLPEKIVSWLDFLVEQGLYKSRAEVIRDFVRDSVVKGGSQ